MNTVPKLGRLIDPDPRDLNYPMRALLRVVPPITSRYWWSQGAWLDQGETGTCVGHAWAHWIEDGPKTWPGTVDPVAIYNEACKLDPWPENDYGDLLYGTSLRAGVQAVQARGKVTEYRWAWDASTVVDALLTKGPVVIGSYWYEHMFEPDDNGMIKVSGPNTGGHCYILNGVNTVKGIVRVKNSWGQSWGKMGQAFLRIQDLDRLIKEDGEACLAVEALN